MCDNIPPACAAPRRAARRRPGGAKCHLVPRELGGGVPQGVTALRFRGRGVSSAGHSFWRRRKGFALAVSSETPLLAVPCAFLLVGLVGPRHRAPWGGSRGRNGMGRALGEAAWPQHRSCNIASMSGLAARGSGCGAASGGSQRELQETPRAGPGGGRRVSEVSVRTFSCVWTWELGHQVGPGQPSNVRLCSSRGRAEIVCWSSAGALRDPRG